jgi:hypothetical protein
MSVGAPPSSPGRDASARTPPQCATDRAAPRRLALAAPRGSERRRPGLRATQPPLARAAGTIDERHEKTDVTAPPEGDSPRHAGESLHRGIGAILREAVGDPAMADDPIRGDPAQEQTR